RLVALRLQAELEHPDDLWFVVDDQDLRRGLRAHHHRNGIGSVRPGGIGLATGLCGTGWSPPAGGERRQPDDSGLVSLRQRVRGSPGQARTNPIGKATEPDPAARVMTWSARSGGTTSTIPTPRLKVARRSSSDAPVSTRSSSNTGGSGHDPHATSAWRGSGSTLGRFSTIPPPVTCAAACS